MNGALQTISSKARGYLRRNSSTILTWVGAIGVIGTAVLAAQATPKAVKLMEAAKEEKGEELTTLEKVKAAAPVYIPTVVVGASTIACIFGANVLNRQNQASLASAYALIDSAYKEYRNKVKELYGEETDRKIRDSIAMDKRENIDVYVPGYGPIDTDGEVRLFYEEYRGKYFESTMEAVINAEYHFNRNYAMRGEAYLNEFYDFLGLEHTKAGDTLGWDCERLMNEYEACWIDFDHRRVELEDGLECYIIDMPIPPALVNLD
jgi:hypothetical protein